MNATELIDDMVSKLPDWRGAAFANIRKIIRDADPGMVEELKWRGTPVWSNNGIVCLAKPFKDKIKVTFYDGASLPDPDKLFNSELKGNKWRAIDLFEGDKINAKSLANLVRSAVALNNTRVKPANKTQGNAQKKSAK